MGLADILFETSASQQETTTTQWGLWDWMKSQVSSAWDYAKDVGAKVVESYVAPKPAPMPQPPTPPLVTVLPKTQDPSRIDWGMGGAGPAPIPLFGGTLGALGVPTLLVIGGVVLLLAKGGKK